MLLTPPPALLADPCVTFDEAEDWRGIGVSHKAVDDKRSQWARDGVWVHLLKADVVYPVPSVASCKAHHMVHAAFWHVVREMAFVRILSAHAVQECVVKDRLASIYQQKMALEACHSRESGSIRR